MFALKRCTNLLTSCISYFSIYILHLIIRPGHPQAARPHVIPHQHHLPQRTSALTTHQFSDTKHSVHSQKPICDRVRQEVPQIAVLIWPDSDIWSCQNHRFPLNYHVETLTLWVYSKALHLSCFRSEINFFLPCKTDFSKTAQSL